MKSVVKGRPGRCGHWSASAETAWLLSVLDSVSLLTGKYQQVPKLMFHILLSVLRAAIARIPLQSSFELKQPISVKPQRLFYVITTEVLAIIFAHGVR